MKRNVHFFLFLQHDSCICVPWLIHVYNITHSYVWHDSFMCTTWLIHTCVQHDSFIFFIVHFPQKSPTISGSFVFFLVWMYHVSLYVESGWWKNLRIFLKQRRRRIGCLIFIGHFPQQSPVISGSFVFLWSEYVKSLYMSSRDGAKTCGFFFKKRRRRIGCLIFIGHFPQQSPVLSASFVVFFASLNILFVCYKCIMSHRWMSHGFFRCLSQWGKGWPYGWVVSHIRMSHVTHINESCCTHEWVTSHIWMSHVTHIDESRHTYEWLMSH